MGRAIVREPAVFLFDEPLSNLNAKLRVQMRLEIRDLQNRLGITALYVTHDQVDAMTMADRMIVMNAGRAEQIGTSLEVYENPKTQFAAQFIDSPSMNVIEAHVTNRQLEIGGGRLESGMALNGPVMLSIRPEHVIPNDQGPFGITVQMGEPLGANTLLHGRMVGTNEAATISLSGVHHAKTGEVIRFGVATQNLHVFDPSSGARL